MSANTVNRLSIVIGIVGLLTFAGGGWLFLESKKQSSGDVVASKAESEKKEGHAEEGEEGEKGHGAEEHGGEKSDMDRPVDELWASKCEHDVAQYECDECRYEVGVVKIPASMMATSGNGGILKTGKPSPMGFAEEFAVTGEVGMNEEKTSHAASPLSGSIRKVYVSVGDRVTVGSPLFDVDSHDVSEAKAAYLKALSGLEVEVADAKADFMKALAALDNEISEGKAAYQKTAATLELAQKTADREKRLFEKNISAKSEVEEAAAKLYEAKVEANNARTKLVRLGVSETVLAELSKGAGAATDDHASGQTGSWTPSETLVDVANAKARLLRLGLSEDEIAKTGKVRHDLSAINALSVTAASGSRQPAAIVEISNAKSRLVKLGVAEVDIAEFAKGGSDLSGVMTVRSPGAGVVLERHGANGEFVESGKDVILISDFSEAWVWANLKEAELSSLRKANGVVMADVELSGGERLRGRVDLASGIVDEGTRNYRARVVVQNPGAQLRPGMFVTVKMLLPGGSDALAVPKSAVLIDEGRPFVFVHKEKEFWIRRPIIAGKEAGGMVEIAEGLTPDQTILTDGSFVAKSDVLRSKMGAGCAD